MHLRKLARAEGCPTDAINTPAKLNVADGRVTFLLDVLASDMISCADATHRSRSSPPDDTCTKYTPHVGSRLLDGPRRPAMVGGFKAELCARMIGCALTAQHTRSPTAQVVIGMEPLRSSGGAVV